jgi:subtilisin family serine protease
MHNKKMLLTNQSDHPVRVAIIDSGIDPTHEKIGAVHEVLLDSVPRQAALGTGHGTACAGIIHQIAPTVALYDVRIFDESLTADGPALLAAIRWTIEQQMDVVNLSLGTTDVAFRDGLAEVCCQARDAGVILVAAETTMDAKAIRRPCRMSSALQVARYGGAMDITTDRDTR